MSHVRTASLLAAATVSALVAGFFYAYSASVNRGLGRLGDADYVVAMQSINETVRNPVFALSFFGALLLLPVAAALHASDRSPRSRWLVAAAALYLVGGFGVTFVFNVPLNEELAAFDLSAASPGDIATARADYETTWNGWNAIRTVASTAALICVVLAALSRAPSPPRPHVRPAPTGLVQSPV